MLTDCQIGITANKIVWTAVAWIHVKRVTTYDRKWKKGKIRCDNLSWMVFNEENSSLLLRQFALLGAAKDFTRVPSVWNRVQPQPWCFMHGETYIQHCNATTSSGATYIQWCNLYPGYFVKCSALLHSPHSTADIQCTCTWVFYLIHFADVVQFMIRKCKCWLFNVQYKVRLRWV